jgi:hypothetical protein
MAGKKTRFMLDRIGPFFLVSSFFSSKWHNFAPLSASNATDFTVYVFRLVSVIILSAFPAQIN